MPRTPEEEAELQELKALVLDMPDDELSYSELEEPFGGIKANMSEGAGLEATIGGLATGVLKGIPQVLTRPADLLARGGNALIESLGGEKKDVTPFLPTNMLTEGVDMLGIPSSPTASAIGEAAGAGVGIATKAPSLIPSLTNATKTLPLLPRAAAVGGGVGAEGAGWGAAFEAAEQNPDYAHGAAVGGATGLITGMGVTGGGEALRDIKQSSFQKAMGYNPEKTARVEAAVDANGNVTRDPNLAVDLVSKKDLKLKDLSESGFLNTIGPIDSPSKVSLKLWQFQQNAGKVIGDTVDLASQAEQSLKFQPDYEKMGWWQSLDDYVNEGKAFKTPDEIMNAAPDFADSQAFVNSVAQSDQMTAQRLQNRLDSIKEAWTASDKSLTTFKTMQENLGITGKSAFNAAKSTPDNLSDTLNNILYGEVASSLRGRIGAIGEAIGDPTLLTKFNQANKAYSAATTFKDSAFNASRQALGTKITKNLTSDIGGTVASGGGTILQSLFNPQILKGSQVLLDIGSKIPMGNALTMGYLAVVPRDWQAVKSDPKSMADVAMKAGLPLAQFQTLPEPVQESIHTQVLLMDPAGAEPVPGNYNIQNGQFLDPREKDYFVKQNLDKPPAERAMAIGKAWENKYMPSETLPPPVVAPSTPSVDIDMMMNSLNGSFEMDNSYNSEASEMTNEMELNKLVHAQDY